MVLLVRRLGHILIDEGLITEEQRDQALRNQTLFGGRIGTNLVALGALELDALARALSRQRGFPAALQKHFDAVQDEAVALIPAHLSQKHYAVPLGFTSRTHETLAVAFADPSKFAVREFNQAAAARVVPVIAPELRVMLYLEKLYGIAPPKRYLAHERGSQQLQVGNREAQAGSRQTETGQSFFDMSRPDLSAPPPGSTSVLPLTEIAPVSELAVPRLKSSSHQPQAEGSVVAPQPQLNRRAPGKTVDQAVDAISSAVERDEIGEALVGYLRSVFDTGLVLIVQYEVAMGWKGFAPAVDDNVIQSLAIPLAAPSLLKKVYEKQSIFVGAPPSEGIGLDGRFWKLLRSNPPREILVAPVVLRDRVVNLIYAQPAASASIPDRAMVDLGTLCQAAAAGYVRLIQSSKNKVARD
jgi:hypothetical protein